MPNANERKAKLGWLSWVLLGLALACGDDGAEPTPDPGEDTEGLAMCCELGAICHPGADDPINSPKQQCHSLGHENEPAACRERYEECLELCGDESTETPHACR